MSGIGLVVLYSFFLRPGKTFLFRLEVCQIQEKGNQEQKMQMEEKQEGKLSSRFDERRKKNFSFKKFSLPSKPKKFFNPFQFPKNGKKISFMGEFQVLPRLKNAVPHLGTMPPGRRLKKKCVVLLLPSSSCPMCMHSTCHMGQF